MARWRLLQPHYINVPGTEWEYTENDRKTGKPKRHKFPVPLHLDPAQPMDWNYMDQDEGMIIVTNKQDNTFPKDILFIGAPTPDMEPLDDDARAISDSFADKWKHPIEALPAQGGFSQTLLNGIQEEVAAASAKSSAAAVEGMTEILATMAAMMKQNQELIATLAADRAPAPAPARRA